MRLALILALTPDRRSGRALSGIIPADEAVAGVKRLIASGGTPDALHPIVQAVSLNTVLREHRCQPSAQQVAVEAADLAKTTDLLHALQQLEQRFAQVELDRDNALAALAEEAAKVAALEARLADAPPVKAPPPAAEASATAAAAAAPAETPDPVAKAPAQGMGALVDAAGRRAGKH